MSHYIRILKNTGIYALDLNYYKETDLHESHVWFDLSSLNSSILFENIKQDCVEIVEYFLSYSDKNADTEWNSLARDSKVSNRRGQKVWCR